jgi:AcrR family transcriptional regulator
MRARAGRDRAGRRERLVAAAEHLVTRDGAEAFSLREAARRAGTDPALVYRHFADRAELIRAVANRGFDALAVKMERALGAARGKGPAAELRAMGRVYLKFALDESALFRIMFGPERGQPPPPSERERPAPFHLLRARLHAYAERGLLAMPPDEAAVMCWAAVHGAAHLALDGALGRTQPESARRLTEMTMDFILRGIGLSKAKSVGRSYARRR